VGSDAPFAELKLSPVEGTTENTYYSIDVECVATGKCHGDRGVAQVALVDQWENVILNIYVKPDKPVVSYLYDLTGLSASLLETGKDFDEAKKMILAALPADAILVGQNILADVQWMGLKEGEDFSGMQDLAGLFRVHNERFKGWSYHSLQHKAKCLLGLDHVTLGSKTHNAATDAIMSMRLYWLFRHLESHSDDLRISQQTLLTAPATPSFATLNAEYEGVCMGNRKTCVCGAPFFF